MCHSVQELNNDSVTHSPVYDHVYSSKDNTADGKQTMYSRATRDRESNKTLQTLAVLVEKIFSLFNPY